MESLTQDQLAYIRRHGGTKNPKTIARDLKLDLVHVQAALQTIHTPRRGARGFDPRTLIWALAIVVVGLVAYSNNYQDGWHFDDYPSIVHNTAIQTPTVAGIYRYNIYRQALYWSFALSWKWHGGSLFGWHVENNAIHILNGLLVYGFTLLTLATPQGRKASRWPQVVAGLTGLIFVAHPLQTQAVTYLTQRTESLCATFYLLALGLYALARFRRLSGRAKADPVLTAAPLAASVGVVILAAIVFGRPVGGLLKPFLCISWLAVLGGAAWLWVLVRKRKADAVEAGLLAGSLAFAFVCMETKEIGGTLPYVLVLWELLFARPDPAPGSQPTNATLLDRVKPHVGCLPYAAMGVLLPLLAVRVGLDAHLLMREGIEDGTAVRPIEASDYFLTELNVFSTYVRLYLLPYSQALDYDYPRATSFFPTRVSPTLLSFGVLAVLGMAALRAFRRAPLLAWGVFSSLLILAPTSSVFVLPDFIFEHRVYLPLAGAALVTVVLLERAVRRLIKNEVMAQQLLMGAFIPILVVFVLATRARNEVWLDDGTLWRDSNANAPRKPRPLTNLGLFYENTEPQKLTVREGSLVLAVSTSGEVKQLKVHEVPLGGDVVDGDVLGQVGYWVVKPTLPMRANPEESQYLVKKSDALGPPVPWGGLDRAIACYDQALALDPGYFKARNNKAVSEIEQGQILIARVYEIRDAIAQSDPNAATTKRLVQVEHEYTDRAYSHFRAALTDLKKILEARPHDVSALGNIASLQLGYLGDLDDAADSMEKSVAEAVNQGDVKYVAYGILGDTYWNRAHERSHARRYEDAKADLLRAIKAYNTFLANAASDPLVAQVKPRLHAAQEYVKNGGVIPEDDGSEAQARDRRARFKARLACTKCGCLFFSDPTGRGSCQTEVGGQPCTHRKEDHR